MFCALFSNKNNYSKIRLTENWNAYFLNNNIIITSNKELINITDGAGQLPVFENIFDIFESPFEDIEEHNVHILTF